MEELRCMEHSEQRAVVFCNQCDSHQVACLRCFQKTGRHYDHRVVTLEEGYSLQLDKYARFVDAVQHKRRVAQTQRDLHEQSHRLLHAKVRRTCRELDHAVETLMRELHEMRLALLTAVQQAAQTARAKTLRKAALASQTAAARSSAAWVRRTRKFVDRQGLVGLIAGVDTLQERCNAFASALDLGANQFNVLELDFALADKVRLQLTSLTEKARVLRHSGAQILQETPCSLAPSRPMGVGREVLYVIGGDDSNSNYIYDPASRAWCQAAPMKEKRWRSAAVFWQGKVVVAGGAKASTDNLRMKSVEQYDPETNQWAALPDLLTNRSSFGLVVFDNTLHAIGGWNGEQYLGSVERYDSSTRQWTYAPPLQVPRHSHASAQFKTKMLTAGGYNGEFTKTCEVYDGVGKAWRFLAPLIIARTGASSATHKDKFYIFGGVGKKGECINEAEVYDCAANKWTEVPVQLSVPRTKSAAAKADGLIYICGGWGSQASDLVECFNPEANSLTCVAALPVPTFGHDVVSAQIPTHIYNQLFYSRPND